MFEHASGIPDAEESRIQSQAARRGPGTGGAGTGGTGTGGAGTGGTGTGGTGTGGAGAGRVRATAAAAGGWPRTWFPPLPR